jgi:hypothetical protein
MTPQYVGDVLEAAATRLETHGWCQDTDVDEAGRCCVLSAISEAATGDAQLTSDLAQAATETLMRVIVLDDVRACRHPEHMIAAWNDSEGRTVEEVVTALREAAAQARLDESLAGPAPVDPPMGGHR